MIDLDIVQAVLFKLGYEVDFKFPRLARGNSSVKSHEYNTIAPIFMHQDEKDFYTSQPIVKYKPMVFSLKKNAFNPISLSDLKSASIATFQGAMGYFGSEFQKLAHHAIYQVIVDMGVLPELLVKERFEYIVLYQFQ
ncbi:MAG: transporter substrate-binding domain-containing protein [Thalassotalea sp.]|nr:transporter substrate-binding domain-containing protein [Thalassotalea sp.]